MSDTSVSICKIYQRIIKKFGGGQVVGRCWVSFQCRGILLIWIIVGQGPVALAVGAEGGCLDIFSLVYLAGPRSAIGRAPDS